MTKPRREQMSLADTPWYHVINRCVRRAYLCGQDNVTGRCYEHRREWIETMMLQLASVFAIDVAAYAVMSNHYNLVLRVNADQVKSWSDDEVLQRWTQLFKGPDLVRRYRDDPAEFNEAMLTRIGLYVEEYRKRLQDISWFMRIMNESIARMANKEDDVKGRFWEGRFKSQALLDEQAIISVMAYVDLNPVRAGIADSLPDSDFTSVKRRITGDTGSSCISADQSEHPLKDMPVSELPLATLMPFDPGGRLADAIAFSLTDYLEFVDYLGRAIHPKKRGYIPPHIPELMKELGLTYQWLTDLAEGRWLNGFGWAIGTAEHLKEVRPTRMKGIGRASKMVA